MGAIVGSLYASGITPDELETLVDSIDWSDAFVDNPRRQELSYRRKQDDAAYPANLELGLSDGEVLVPKGLIQGQKLQLILREQLLHVSHINDFDDLPTPFRAVASDIATGEVRWTYTAEDSYFSSPAVGTDLVIVGGRDRHLRALDRTTGEEVWSHACRANLDSSPVIAGDRVVVGSSDGRIYAVTLDTGTLVWEHALGGPVTSSVAVAGGIIFVGCEDGTLYALGERR